MTVTISRGKFYCYQIVLSSRGVLFTHDSLYCTAQRSYNDFSKPTIKNVIAFLYIYMFAKKLYKEN